MVRLDELTEEEYEKFMETHSRLEINNQIQKDAQEVVPYIGEYIDKYTQHPGHYMESMIQLGIYRIQDDCHPAVYEFYQHAWNTIKEMYKK